ncbi:MAG TPA: hypothetical protein PLV88_01825, partial [Methanoregulaceae archaeon]|nr:hypothetical protein [Methanoregulaceae archaeon]
MGQSYRGHCSDAGTALWAVIAMRGQVHLPDAVKLGLCTTITRFEQTDGSMPYKRGRYKSTPQSEGPFPVSTGRQEKDGEIWHL